MRLTTGLVCIFTTVVAALLLGSGLASGQTPAPAEEFVGPFPSWTEIQCSGTDDTNLLQTALNNVGLPGQSPVLYIAPGTCRITSTLRLGTSTGVSKHQITILGADPGTTRIVWAGPAGGTMLAVDGVGHSRYGRLTWDGGGSARAVYVLSQTPNTGMYYSAANRHEDEVFSDLAPDGVAVRAGDSGIGDSETEWIRCHFLGPMAAGILLKNFNVGDYWIWDSEFKNVSYGVTNIISNSENGAGWFAVNRSNFLNSQVADMAIANTGFFSSRWNYSVGSGQHVLSYPIGNAPSAWTAQGETVIDPVHTSYSFGSVGPFGLLDSTIRDNAGDGRVSVNEGYAAQPGGDLWAAGNRFSSANAPPYTTGASGRVHIGGDDQGDAAIQDPGPLALPPAPPASSAAVIEVQNGDIAAALASAGSSRAVVHVPYGTYQITRTLEVGPNVVLTGDGYGATDLRSAGADPILHLTGPSHAVLRDFSLNGGSQQSGQRNASGIVIDNVDQPGGLIHSEQWIGAHDEVGIQVSDLQSTLVDLLDTGAGTNSHLDTGAASPSVDYRVTNARVHIFNGAGATSDEIYELHGGELVAQTMYYESAIPTTYIAPGSSGTLILDTGRLAGNPGLLDTSSFSGSLTLIGIGDIGASGNPMPPNSRVFGPNTLLLGYVFGWLPTDSALPTFTSGPYAMWLPRQNQGGGSVSVAEQAAGVDDQAQFQREHLAPLASTVPTPLTARPAD
ncbi:MAG: hypothetical protein JOZ87_09310, partial [Chloroflexi bacterium]|nr:hypothetical protein [Chloroflexota bacterium]